MALNDDLTINRNPQIAAILEGVLVAQACWTIHAVWRVVLFDVENDFFAQRAVSLIVSGEPF